MACDGLVYSLGGKYLVDDELVVDTVDIYVPDVERWLLGPSLPFAMELMAAVEHMGCIYACRGRSNSSPAARTFLMLDPRSRSWASMPSMPTPPTNTGAAVVAGRLYLPGMWTRAGAMIPTLQCYDMAAGRWDTCCAPMMEARQVHGVAAVHGEVWVVGGLTVAMPYDFKTLASVEVYSPRLNTWRAGVPLPHATMRASCVVLPCS